MKKETPVFKLAETPQKSAEIIQFPQHKIVRMPVEPDETEKLDKSKRKQADRIIHELTQDIIDELHIGYDVDVVAPDFQKDFSYSMECVRATIYRSFGCLLYTSPSPRD